MKAWNVTDFNGLRVTIVFAETAGRAKSIALCTDDFEDCDYKLLKARRMPKLDGFASVPGECDWDDAKLIITLVRECGWSCKDPDWVVCASCPAAEWCGEKVPSEGEEEQP